MCSQIVVVPGKGFEPPRPHRATDFESAASAISPPRQQERPQRGTARSRTAPHALPLQRTIIAIDPTPVATPLECRLPVARVTSLSTTNRIHAPQPPLWDAYAGPI